MAGSRRPVPERFARVYDGYADALARADLDGGTRRAYDSRVRSFLAWLDSAPPPGGPDPLAGPAGRDTAKQGYLDYLMEDRQLAASTASAHLTAVDHFFGHLGLGPVRVPRSHLPPLGPGRVRTPRGQMPPRQPAALDAGEQERYLRAAGRRPLARDRAIGYLLVNSGLRVSELVALDVGDVRRSAGECTIIVRSGNPRGVPLLDRPARIALDEWEAERASWPGSGASGALFLSRRGHRLSARAVGLLVAGLAADAGLTGEAGSTAATPQALRSTYGANQLGAGADVVTVARLMGRRHVDTGQMLTVAVSASTA
jgi:site-specific recombinase XerC